MEALTGFLLSTWISICILAAIVLSILGLAGLICTLAPLDLRVPRFEAFSGFICCTLLAGFFYIHICHLLGNSQETPENSKTRDILLTVPEKSSVNAQVTSENNMVNIQNL